MKLTITRAWVGASVLAFVVLAGCGRGSEKAATTPAPRLAAGSGSVVDGDTQPQVPDENAHYNAVHGDGGHESVGHEERHGKHEHFEAEGALVSNHGLPLLQETQTAGGFTPPRRARIVAKRLNDMAATHDLKAEHIVMRFKNGLPTVFFFHPHRAGEPGHVLATIDPKTAAQFGFARHPQRLAFWWRDVLRDHASIISGEPPTSTTPYAQPLQRLYALCQREHSGVPTHESFEKALSRLTQQERNALQSLYISVPANYRPQPNGAPSALPAKAAGHEEGGHHHDE